MQGSSLVSNEKRNLQRSELSITWDFITSNGASKTFGEPFSPKCWFEWSYVTRPPGMVGMVGLLVHRTGWANLIVCRDEICQIPVAKIGSVGWIAQINSRKLLNIDPENGGGVKLYCREVRWLVKYQTWASNPSRMREGKILTCWHQPLDLSVLV